MDLWTIQTEEFYEELRKNGVIHTDPEKIDKDFRSAYDWLCAQMRRRLPPPPPGVRYPIWAWHTWDWMHKRPDLRLERFRNPDPEVRLDIRIPDGHVLLSDYGTWHFVLNDWLLGTCTCEEEWDKEEAWFYALPKARQRAEKRRSWQRVFDVTPFDNGWRRTGMDIQATFWELRLENVRKVSFHPAKRIGKI